MRCSSESRSSAAKAWCARSPASSTRVVSAIAPASWLRARRRASSSWPPMCSARIRASRTTTSASTSSISGSRWPCRPTRRSAWTRRSTCSAAWAMWSRSARCRPCVSSRLASTSTWLAGVIPPRRRCARLRSSSRRAVRRQSARSVPCAHSRSTCRLCPSRSRSSVSGRALRPASSSRSHRRCWPTVACAASPPCSITARPASSRTAWACGWSTRTRCRRPAASWPRTAASPTATSARSTPTGRTGCSR